MGPGDGTLMSDAPARRRRLAPGFSGPPPTSGWWRPARRFARGRRRQLCRTIEPFNGPSRLEDVPAGAPVILIANELLDCLPARQFIRTDAGWAERRVGLGRAGALSFGLSPAPAALIPTALRALSVGAFVEVSSAQEQLGRLIGERLGEDGGAALFIDYGRDAPGPGDTLQALSRHKKVDPLETAGEADLTMHADFPPSPPPLASRAWRRRRSSGRGRFCAGWG